jgi:cytoskeletal protein CcmA (bactofilin family)
LSDANETLTIDPVKEGIVNRIAAGTVHKGDLSCSAGLWVEGTIEGNLEVDGVLVLSPGSTVSGRIVARGPRAVLAGAVLPAKATELSEIYVAGTAYLASTLNAKAKITAGAYMFYTGAQVDGGIFTGQVPAAAHQDGQASSTG